MLLVLSPGGSVVDHLRLVPVRSEIVIRMWPKHFSFRLPPDTPMPFSGE